MPSTSDLQQMTDVEQAKAKLQEVAETKEGMKDPRASEKTGVVKRDPQPRIMEKDIRPVAAKPKKKGFGQKLKEAMFAEDIGNGSVSDYIFFRIFVPSVKRVVSEMANTAINMLLGLDPKTRTVGNTHVSNASLYRDRNYNRPVDNAYRKRSAISEYEWDEETAKDIYNQIQEVIERYGECSLADVYSIMGLGDRIRTTDRNWGWTSMRNIDVVPVNAMRDSWIIDMPDARPLK